jgi:hypothetical protein
MGLRAVVQWRPAPRKSCQAFGQRFWPERQTSRPVAIGNSPDCPRLRFQGGEQRPEQPYTSLPTTVNRNAARLCRSRKPTSKSGQRRSARRSGRSSPTRESSWPSSSSGSQSTATVPCVWRECGGSKNNQAGCREARPPLGAALSYLPKIHSIRTPGSGDGETRNCLF